MDKCKIQKVVEAYIKGSRSFVINGRKYLIDGLQEIKIFTYERTITEIEFINECMREGGLGYPEPYTNKIILYPKAFLKIGTDVTEEFIGDSEYGGASFTEEFEYE